MSAENTISTETTVEDTNTGDATHAMDAANALAKTTEHFGFEMLHPIVLHKEDLLELEGIFKRNLNCKKKDFNITVGLEHHHSAKNFHSLTEIYEHETPDKTDEFILLANETDEKDEVIRGMRTTLTKNLVSYRFFGPDKDWFDQVAKELKLFYQARRPWYAPISIMITQFGIISLIIALFTSVVLSEANNVILSNLPLLAAAYGVAVLVLGLTGKVFAYNAIHLRPKAESKKGFELPVFIVGIIILGGAIVSSLLLM